MKLTFKQCTLALLDKLFDLQEVTNTPLLKTWLENEIEISDTEQRQVEFLQGKLTENFRIWNEIELAYGFIAPLLTLVDFSEKNLKFFAGRSLDGKIGDVELSGKPDGMIASGQLIQTRCSSTTS